MIYSAIRKHRRVRGVTDAPRSKVASAAQGFVELEGFAWPTSQTVKSKDDAEVLYCSFELQREESQGSGTGRQRKWVTVFSHKHADPFYLVDATGVALIDPSVTEMRLQGESRRSWHSIDAAERVRICEKVVTSAVPRFPPSNFLNGLFSAKFRVVEGEIRVGSPLHVSGDFRPVVDGSKKVTAHGLTYFCNRVFDPVTRSLKKLKLEAKVGYSQAAKSACLNATADSFPEMEFELVGTLGRSETCPLFVADAIEENLKGSLPKSVRTRFTAGSALVTLGIALSLGISWYSEVPVPRTIASVTSGLNVAALHSECVTGRASSCGQLIQFGDGLHLSAQHMAYYKKRACALGSTSFCK